MTTLNGRTNTRSMNGLTEIYADSVITDNVECDTIQTNYAIVNTNLNIPSFPNVSNTLADHDQRLTGISYNSSNDTTIIDNAMNIKGGINANYGNTNYLGDVETETITNNQSITLYGSLLMTASTGVINQTGGSGTNIMKAISQANVNLTQSGTSIISQTGTGTNVMKSISQFTTAIITQIGTGENVIKSTQFTANVRLTNASVITQTSTSTNINNLSRTYVRSSYGQSSAVPFAVVDDISGTQLILTSNNGQGSYSAVVRGGDSSIVAIGAGSDRSISALSLTLFSETGSAIGTRYSNQSVFNRYSTTTAFSTTTLDASGFTIVGNTRINGSMDVSGNLSISNYTNVGDSLTTLTTKTTDISYVSGNTTIAGNLFVSQGLQVGGALNFSGDVGVAGNLGVSGSLNLGGNILQTNPALKNTMSEINLLSGQDIVFNGSGAINQLSSTATNYMRSIVLSGNEDIVFATGTTGKIQQFTTANNQMSNIAMNSNCSVSFSGTGILTQTGTSINNLKSTDISGSFTVTGATTIGSGAKTTTFNTRAFNVIDGAGGIRLGRISAANAGFIELCNISNDGLTLNNIAAFGGGTSGDERFRFFFRPPAGGNDVDVMYLRRTGLTLSTKMDISGDITLLNQSSIIYPDGSIGRTYIRDKISSIDVFNYDNIKTSSITTVLQTTYDYMSVTSTIISVAANNIAWALIKIVEGETYRGAWYYTNASTANVFSAIYGFGASAPRLIYGQRGLTTTANAFNYIAFTDPSGIATPYTCTQTQYAYVGIFSTSASVNFYTYDNTNTNFGKTAVNNALTLRCCTSANTNFPTPFSGVVTGRTTLYLMGLYTY